MKILVANLGSTSLKWRLFDFSDGQERLLHKGGFERVADYPKAIGDCLAQLKEAGHIESEKDLAAVGFKTIMARGMNGCVRLDEGVVGHRPREAVEGELTDHPEADRDERVAGIGILGGDPDEGPRHQSARRKGGSDIG